MRRMKLVLREGLTAPGVLTLALLALLVLVMLGSMPPRVQARGRDAAMQTKTETRTDRPTRRRGESLAVVRPPDGDAIGSRVEGAAREGLTAPEVLTLALLALLVLVMLGSMFVFSFLYVLLLLFLPGLVVLLLWLI